MLLPTDVYRVTVIVDDWITASFLLALRRKGFQLISDCVLVGLIEDSLRLRRPNHGDIFAKATCLQHHFVVRPVEGDGLLLLHLLQNILRLLLLLFVLPLLTV